MNSNSLLALAWLAISFAVPTFAPEQKAADPKTRREDRIAAISEYSIPGVIRSHSVKIYVRDADTYGKIPGEFVATTHSPR